MLDVGVGCSEWIVSTNVVFDGFVLKDFNVTYIIYIYIISKYHYCYHKVNLDFEEEKKSYFRPSENGKKGPKTTIFMEKYGKQNV